VASGSAPIGPAVSGAMSGSGSSSTASISPIGVIPNTGSRENGQPEDSAPINFPST
jgi:hypothetical protein